MRQGDLAYLAASAVGAFVGALLGEMILGVFDDLGWTRAVRANVRVWRGIAREAMELAKSGEA